MPVPVVSNEHGHFEYSLTLRRWICLDGKVPGASVSGSVNCCVHMAYSGELSRQALADGFTQNDFGYNAEDDTVKEKKARKPRERKTLKTSVKKKFSLDSIDFDF